jgi:hypothetical protein
MKRAVIAAVALILATASPVSALWHARAPFTLTLANHASTNWAPYIAQAAADWSASPVLDITVGSNGKFSVYDGAYGTNYPASWTTLTYGGGYTKTATISLNDSWLDGFTPAQKQHAVCAEIGNAISSDEGCRDRVTGEWFSAPTAEDFAELELIYGP